jgi:S-phase kinase-associated protein 1
MGASDEEMMQTVRLRGKDGEAVEVPENVITASSPTIKAAIDNGACAGVVELPTLTAATLSRVVEYVKKHFGSGGDGYDPLSRFDDDPLSRFDADFVNVDNDTLIDLIEAATLLDIGGLLDLTCKAVAEQMKGRPIVEIRKKFNIVNDYTEEEEEEVRRENSWAFE